MTAGADTGARADTTGNGATNHDATNQSGKATASPAPAS
jgi:hypothetical protein